MCKAKRTVTVIGIGMGAAGSLTLQAEQAVKECDCIIGAKRMLEALSSYQKKGAAYYLPEDIHAYIREHPQFQKIVIALSGDVGFYSGAKKLLPLLSEYTVEVLPGISAVVYLAARIGVSWEDARLISLHGKSQNLIHTIVHNAKTFVLLGDVSTGAEICRKLQYYGLTDLQVTVGKQLSYDGEEIIKKLSGALLPEDMGALATAYIENPYPECRICRHVQDEAFIRGNIPMTKEEVRSVSIAKLQLSEHSVLYDIGAGTGSVAVEAAMQGAGVRVYAVEKNPEGCCLIRQNRQRFQVDNLELIPGEAPEALRGLPAPTHAFIGGSSGNLKEILQTLKQKNGQVRVVMNVISLETIAEVMDCVREGLMMEPEIVQLSVSKARAAGAHHLMSGQNPIYIITC